MEESLACALTRLSDEAWYALRCATVWARAAWALLAFGVLCGWRAERKDHIVCITVVAWHLTLLGTWARFISAFNMCHSDTNLDVMFRIWGAMATLLPSLLLTVPVVWVIFKDRRAPLPEAQRILLLSAFTGLVNVLVLAWALGRILGSSNL